MKTRNDIYQAEAATLLHIITTYHTITFDQAIRFFPQKEDTLKNLIRKLIKQKRLYFDENKDLLCDRAEAAESPDYGMIAALWVLLDFKKSILHHISSDFPTKITFFAQDDIYEIIYVPQEQEALINHVLSITPKDNANRLVLLESEDQAPLVSIPNTIAFCIVKDGVVSYYQKGGTPNEQI